MCIFLNYNSSSMCDTPVISVIVPAYNAMPYLPKLIESLKLQTFNNWEMVCVDDCSTDGTWEYLQQVSATDARIRIHQLPRNSGSAKIPRDTAAKLSSAAWLCPIDADDWIEPQYMEILLQKQKETQADMVLSSCIQVDAAGGKELERIPAGDFDLSKIYSSEEAINLTLRAWKISLAGALIPKFVWCNSEVFMDSEFTHLNADEYSSRELLGSVESIVCSTAKYFYRMHSGSVTHDNTRSAEQIYTDYRLFQYARKKFSHRTVLRTYSRYIEGLFSITKKILRKVYPVSPDVLDYIKAALSGLNALDIWRTDLPVSIRIKYIVRLKHYKSSLEKIS